MKKIAFLFFLLLVTLFSCKEIKFKEPQPMSATPLNEFPKELIGIYVESVNNDTLIITAKGFSYGTKSSLDYFEGELSDSIVLKQQNGAYFVNLFEKELWSLIFVEITDTNTLVASFISAEFEEITTKIKSITPLEPVLDIDSVRIKYYIAQPTESELKKIIDQELFSSSVVFNRITP